MSKSKTYYTSWYFGKLDMPVLFTEDELEVMTSLVHDDIYWVGWKRPDVDDDGMGGVARPVWTLYKRVNPYKHTCPEYEWTRGFSSRAELVAMARLINAAAIGE